MRYFASVLASLGKVGETPEIFNIVMNIYSEVVCLLLSAHQIP
jgi:hypothetical protein